MAQEPQRLSIRAYRWASNLLYGRLACAYDAVSWLVSLGRWAGWRRAALAHVEGPRVLDVGFGTGDLLIEMQRSGLEPVGLDPSENMHRVTSRKLRRRGARIPRVRAQAQAMPFVDGSFDSAVATFPAWYILDRATLNEVARVVGRRFQSGRFVVIGLAAGRRRRSAAGSERIVLSRADERILTRFRGLAEEAGLRLAIEAERHGRWQPLVAVLRKRHP